MKNNEIGFGDVSTEPTKVKISINGLTLSTFPCKPLFDGMEDEKICPVEKIVEQDKCLCNRFNVVGRPLLPQGDVNSKVVFVGGVPGRFDIEKGIPFLYETPGGGLFEEILEILGVTREEVYVTNTLFCASRARTTPTPDEIYACARFHNKEFRNLKQVKYIFALGTHAFQLLTGVYSSGTTYVGSYFKIQLGGREVFVIPLPHPGTCLRNAAIREKTFSVLKSLVGEEVATG